MEAPCDVALLLVSIALGFRLLIRLGSIDNY